MKAHTVEALTVRDRSKETTVAVCHPGCWQFLLPAHSSQLTACDAFATALHYAGLPPPISRNPWLALHLSFLSILPARPHMPGILAGVLHSTSDGILGCVLGGTFKVLIKSSVVYLVRYRYPFLKWYSSNLTLKTEKHISSFPSKQYVPNYLIHSFWLFFTNNITNIFLIVEILQ